MAVALVLILAMLAMAKGSDAAWCVCRTDLSDAYLQKTLDYACGAGADCTQIQQNGACFNPNTVRAHCSYAANSYYQRKGQAQQACQFSGTAILSNSDPSTAGCTYPASISAAGTSATPSTTMNPGLSAPTIPGTTPVTPAAPGTFTPTTGTGAMPGGFGPSGNTFTDTSNGFLSNSWEVSIFSSIIVSMVAVLRLLR